MADNAVKALIGDILNEIIEEARDGGGKKTSVGLMAYGSELGQEELCKGARLAQQNDPSVKVFCIGPKLEGYEGRRARNRPRDGAGPQRRRHRRSSRAPLSLPRRRHDDRKGIHPRQRQALLHSLLDRHIVARPHRGHAPQRDIRNLRTRKSESSTSTARRQSSAPSRSSRTTATTSNSPKASEKTAARYSAATTSSPEPATSASPTP